MSGVKIKVRGSYRNTENFLQRMQKGEMFRVLEKYGAIGVAALKEATPIESAETAQHWSYEIVSKPGYFSIHWINDHRGNENPHVPPVAILLQYGHATRNGGYVQGQDFINPALKSIFDQIASDMWKEVTK